MKVVLFCGGLGMRMRDGVTSGPKPMAMIGDRPLMWHVMRYYAHYGHTDFVLCLGYGASYVKDFFLNYDETRSNDFVLEGGDRQVKLFRTDISDWRITFVDTGLNSAIGERLRRVLAYPYKGYWSPADTVKERAQLEEMYHRGQCPWMVWDPERSGVARNGVPLAPASA